MVSVYLKPSKSLQLYSFNFLKMILVKKHLQFTALAYNISTVGELQSMVDALYGFMYG